jgi:hypothetical protein
MRIVGCMSQASSRGANDSATHGAAHNGHSPGRAVINPLARVLIDASAELGILKQQGAIHQTLVLQVSVKSKQGVVICFRQFGKPARVRTLCGMRIITVSLDPKHVSAGVAGNGRRNQAKRPAKLGIRLGAGRALTRDSLDAWNRIKRRTCCGVYESNLRIIGSGL